MEISSVCRIKDGSPVLRLEPDFLSSRSYELVFMNELLVFSFCLLASERKY